MLRICDHVLACSIVLGLCGCMGRTPRPEPAAQPRVRAVELPADGERGSDASVTLTDGRTLAVACARVQREWCGSGDRARREWASAGDRLWLVCGRGVDEVDLRDGSKRTLLTANTAVNEIVGLTVDARGRRFALAFNGPAASFEHDGPTPAREPSLVVYDEHGRELMSSLRYGPDVSMSADGRWLARVIDSQIELWDLDALERRTIEHAAERIVFVGSERLVFVGGDAWHWTLERMVLATGESAELMRMPRPRPNWRR
jgi:hypothetical protein